MTAWRAVVRADPWWVQGWWVCVGASGGLAIAGIRTIGVYLGMPGAVMFVVCVLVPRLRTSAAFLSVSGLSVALFVVAYLNRGGPGRVCQRTAMGQTCIEAWNPLPFIAVGLVFVVLGVGLYARSLPARVSDGSR